MRVHIRAAGDTIVFKFIQPHVDTGLEGYILGYGSSMFSKQFIHLPEDGQPYETEIGTIFLFSPLSQSLSFTLLILLYFLDAEPKYLIAVQSKKPEEPKKQCTGKKQGTTNEIWEQFTDNFCAYTGPKKYLDTYTTLKKNVIALDLLLYNSSRS